ncbi:MAG: Maf family nucleotide pyrophosphatase [Marinobacter sp.]|nr:Maf family nucleotide pyrophosphatase [Marinobacter sp.]
MKPLILASSSPRRRELLAQMGLPFSVCPVDVDESVHPGELPAAYVERLARDKALAGYRLPQAQDTLVLGSDTTVVFGERIMGKPADRAEAAAMLQALSGETHRVLTAVALAGDFGCYARLSVTEVSFRPLAKAEIAAYCDTDEPLDKAGGYGIQGRGGIFVSGLWGSYSGVVGLPLQETAELLAEAGQPVWRYWHAT